MGIAKKVVESHRGRIELNSRVGEGTELSISIPLADAARAWINADLNGAAPTANQNGTAPAPTQGPAVSPVSNVNSSANVSPATARMETPATVPLSAAPDSTRTR
jgi:hypothetical protein